MLSKNRSALLFVYGFCVKRTVSKFAEYIFHVISYREAQKYSDGNHHFVTRKPRNQYCKLSKSKLMIYPIKKHRKHVTQVRRFKQGRNFDRVNNQRREKKVSRCVTGITFIEFIHCVLNNKLAGLIFTYAKLQALPKKLWKSLFKVSKNEFKK